MHVLEEDDGTFSVVDDEDTVIEDGFDTEDDAWDWIDEVCVRCQDDD